MSPLVSVARTLPPTLWEDLVWSTSLLCLVTAVILFLTWRMLK